MSADSESFPTSSSAVAASRFDRNGVTTYNLALRLTGSPGAAWYATIAAYAAVTERVPADAAPGVDDQDLVLMSCWHARQLLAQVAGDPGYAEQLRAHDAATRAALRQDGQLGGPEAQATLEEWIAADPGHAEIVDGLEAAGQAYRAWPLDAAPAGLRDAAVAAAAAVTPAALLGTPPQVPVESMPAGEHDRPIEPPAAPERSGRAEPRSAPDAGAADPGATVEWSPSEVAALGLEGAPVRPAPLRPMVPLEDDEPEWNGDDQDGPLTGGGRDGQPRERAPRWHIALVGVLLIAVIVVLILTFTSSDEPTTPVTPSTTTTKTRSAVPADDPVVAAVAAAVRAQVA